MARRRLLFSYFYITYNGNKYGSEVTVSPFSEEGGTDTFKVTSSKPWTVISAPDWVTLTPDLGAKGETSVLITVFENQTTTVKTGDVTIRTSDGRYTAVLHVRQSDNLPYIFIDNSDSDVTKNVSFRNTTSAFTIKSRGGWTMAITGGTSTVTAVTATTSVETPITVNYSANSADTANTNTITLVLTNTLDNTIVKTITINQAATSYINMTRSGSDPNYIPYNGEVGTISVATNIGGYIYEEAGPIDLSKTIGVQTENITYTASTLTTAQTTPVSYVITAKTSDFSNVDGIDSKNLTLTYEAYPYLNLNTITISSAETSTTVNYDSNYHISSQPGTGTPASITIATGETGGNKTLTVNLDNQGDWVDQTFQLVVNTTGTVGPAISETVSVVKSHKVAELELTPHTTSTGQGYTYIEFDSNDTVTVDTNSLPSWLQFSGINYTTNRIEFIVAAWTGDTQRNATITVTTTHNGSDGNPVTETTTLTQEAIPYVDTYVSVNAVYVQDSNGDWTLTTNTTDTTLTLPMSSTTNGVTTVLTVNSSSVNIGVNTTTGSVITSTCAPNEIWSASEQKHYILTYQTTYNEYNPNVIPVTINYYFKQDSGGTWYVKTLNNDGFTSAITITYNGTDFSTSANNGDYVQTPFTSSTTPISATFSPNEVSDSGSVYRLTYSESENQPYQETLTGTTITSVDLTYDDTDFKANGSASTTDVYCEPSVFTINYVEHYSNTFDSNTVDYNQTTAITSNISNYITGLTVSTQNGGSVVDTYKISASSRGTTTGNSQNVATISEVKYDFEGSALTTPLATSIVFTQEANSVVSEDFVSSSQTREEASVVTHYTNIGFTVSRDDNGQGFNASGMVIGQSYDNVDVEVVETGETYDVTTYDYTGTTSYTATYTSGERKNNTVHDYWSDDETSQTVTYSERAIYSGYSQGTGFSAGTATNHKQRVWASNRGTTTGSSRNITLNYRSNSNHGTVKTTGVTITQAANTRSSQTVTDSVVSGLVNTQVVSSSTAYTQVSVWFSGNTSTPYTIPASGGSLTIKAYESGKTQTTTARQYNYAETSTTHTEYTYSSGAHNSSSPTTAVTSSWTTYDTTTGSEVSYGPIDITSRVTKSGNSNITWSSGTVSAESRGTTTGSSQTATLSVTSEHKSTATASATVTREANEIVGERWIDIRSGVEISAASVSNCYLIVSPNTFSARTGTMSTTITVKSAVDTTRITGVTADCYDVYTSNASAKTGDDIIVSANTVSSHVAVRPSTGWTTSPTYSITISSPSVNGSAYTYTATTSTASNPPTSTISNGVLKFSNPSGSSTCTGQTAFAYSGTPAPVGPVYPTVSVNSLQANEQYGCSGTFQFTNSGQDATPNATWEFTVNLEFVPFDGDANVTITGKTSSDGYGLSTLGIKEVSGSHSSEEFTLKKIGTTQFQCYITTPAAYSSSIVNSYTQPDSITS